MRERNKVKDKVTFSILKVELDNLVYNINNENYFLAMANILKLNELVLIKLIKLNEDKTNE